jgi:hypothetical protein
MKEREFGILWRRFGPEVHEAGQNKNHMAQKGLSPFFLHVEKMGTVGAKCGSPNV